MRTTDRYDDAHDDLSGGRTSRGAGGYDDVHDAALADRLSAALGRTAATTPLPADAWASLQARLGETDAAATLFEAVGYAEAETVTGHDDVLSDAGAPTVALPAASPSGPGWTAPPPPRSMRWRVPLIAAASVAVVAAGVAAASTGLFGAGGSDGTHAAAPSTSSTTPPLTSAPVSIPIVCAATEPEPCISVTGATLQFVDDPDGTEGSLALSAEFYLTDEGASGARASSVTVGNDEPLGFLSGSGSGRVDIVLGAASPDVAAVLIQTSQTDGTDGGAAWAFDADEPSVLLPAPYDTVPADVWKHTVWTEIAAGWHGYAIHLPEGRPLVHVVAIGADGVVMQSRTFNVETGEMTSHLSSAVLGTASPASPVTTFDWEPPTMTTLGGALDRYLATMTGEPTRGVLAELEASKRAEAIHSAAESADASISAAASAAESEARQGAEATASAIAKHVHQTELQVERAKEEALAAQAGLSSAEEAAAHARAEADALPANASDAERAEAEARREMAEVSFAAAQEASQRAQALLDDAKHQAALASAAAKSLADQNATTAGN